MKMQIKFEKERFLLHNKLSGNETSTNTLTQIEYSEIKIIEIRRLMDIKSKNDSDARV